LFCDLVGSTALGDRSDPELLRELMARYHRELRTILERHGATVEKFVGDAAMAVFGIPRADEDDALRAVRAAVEIRTAVAGLALQARIGVNTGEVVAGTGETLVTGDAVNVAARLEQAAKAGEILIGPATERLVRDAVHTEGVEPLELKGKVDPVRAYRLIEVLPDVPAFARLIDAPFVGRQRELEALERTLTGSIDERSPQLATIVGPPGIGKSRLARELIQRAETRVLVGRCLSYGEGITYWPLAEVASQIGDLRAVLGDNGDSNLAASRLRAALATAETAETAASSEEIAWGFRKLFEALARTEPLIVVLDDIHWAEPTLLDLIEYVSTFAQDAPLFVLCLARPDLLERRPAWATPRPNTTLVTLEPIAEKEAEMLVEELRDVPDETRARIVAAAESEDGDLEIPPTIHALLSTGIDRLESDERSGIERASIEGRMFHRGSVAELLPEGSRSGVGSQLITLVRKELIRPDRATLPGDDGFRFGHILIRDAAYDSIPKMLRAELHERFADWLVTKLGEDAPDEILGYHLERAYRYRVELGGHDEHARKLAIRAGRLLVEAGRRAEDRGEVAATCSLLGSASDLLPEDDLERPSLLELLGLSTLEAGDAPQALEILNRAKSAAAAEARRRAARPHGRADSPPQSASGRGRRSCRHRSGGGNLGATRAGRCRRAGACVEARRGRRKHASRFWAQSGGRRPRTGLRATRPTARRGRRGDQDVGFCLAHGPTPVEEAIRRIAHAFADFPEEHPGAVAFAGRHEEAEHWIERGRRTYFDLGQRLLHASSSMDLGWIALLAGRPERAEQELRAGAEILEAAGERAWLSTVAGGLAEVLYRLGREDEVEECTRKSEQAASIEDVIAQAEWRPTRAKLARRGEADEALRLSAEAVEQVRRCDSLNTLGECLSDRRSAPPWGHFFVVVSNALDRS
jgi:class 3 adenylate cyclase/tetratricopeptide (TPR) repeat protein